MGSSSSKADCEPPGPTYLEKPWRRVDWGEKQELLNFVKDKFRPFSDEISRVRVLLYGPVGSGKSSFVNSVSTVILGRSANIAPTRSSREGVSFTVEYKTHKIRKENPPYESYPFVFNDMMGLEASRDGGVRTDDIKLILKGHVREGYKFNSLSPLSETNTQYYNPSPSANDKVHILVCVLNGSILAMNPGVTDKINTIREAARDLGIPHVAIFTHIDLICREIAEDVKNIFKIYDVMKKVEEFSVASGFDKSHIFPVRNYCDGLCEGDDDVDTLILSALKYMLEYANDFIKASQQ